MLGYCRLECACVCVLHIILFFPPIFIQHNQCLFLCTVLCLLSLVVLYDAVLLCVRCSTNLVECRSVKYQYVVTKTWTNQKTASTISICMEACWFLVHHSVQNLHNLLLAAAAAYLLSVHCCRLSLPGVMETTQDADSGDASAHQDPELSAGEMQNGVEKVKVKRPLKPLNKKKVESYNEGLKKRGVVYLSRVPPFMKPAKIKHLMEQHGVVSRVSLGNTRSRFR